MAANKAPTGNPKRDSTLSMSMKKAMYATKNATYMPIKHLKKITTLDISGTILITERSLKNLVNLTDLTNNSLL